MGYTEDDAAYEAWIGDVVAVEERIKALRHDCFNAMVRLEQAMGMALRAYFRILDSEAGVFTMLLDQIAFRTKAGILHRAIFDRHLDAQFDDLKALLNNAYDFRNRLAHDELLPDPENGAFRLASAAGERSHDLAASEQMVASLAVLEDRLLQLVAAFDSRK